MQRVRMDPGFGFQWRYRQMVSIVFVLIVAAFIMAVIGLYLGRGRRSSGQCSCYRSR
jgi:hypothetical protein